MFDFLEGLFEFLEDVICYFVTMIISAFITITLPLWIVPYLIYKKRKGGSQN